MFFKIYYQIYQQIYQNLYRFRKYAYTSPARRSACYFHTRLNYQKKFKHLSIYKKWNAGRNDSGKIVIWTKSSLLTKQRLIKVNYSFRYLKLGFIAGFQFIPFKNKLLSLIYFASGAITYFLTTELHLLFFYTFYNRYKRLRKIKLKSIFLMLFRIKKLSFVSCVELIPGRNAQYIRSPGVKGKIINFDKETRSVLIVLPSSTNKTFSYHSFALLDKISISLHSRCNNTKSGYWRSFGLKSIVRGVAMNPVDHPHGGRTKAIRYQRTPWGKTTKFK